MKHTYNNGPTAWDDERRVKHYPNAKPTIVFFEQENYAGESMVLCGKCVGEDFSMADLVDDKDASCEACGAKYQEESKP